MLRVIWLFVVTIAVAGTAESSVLDLCDKVTFTAGNDKVRVEQVVGHAGKAMQFTFAQECTNTFAMGRVRGRPEWDRAAGISFWVKGDGSAALGALQFVWNDDYAVRYDASFPITSTAWTKVVIPWSELIPVAANEKSVPLDPAGERKPSQLGQLWFGKWWYWREYPTHSYVIDDLQLEPTIALDAVDHRPSGAPLARVVAKLKAGQPLTVVTMGDSLTDTHHWSNRTTNWPAYFRSAVQERWKSAVTLVNPAIGGTELKQNLVLIPRWTTSTPTPDLVTMCFGFNDWSNGMRPERFKPAMIDAIRRVRRATKGAADVLVIATLPGMPLWDELGGLAQAGRDAAAQEHAGLCDGYAVFMAAAKDGGRERLFVDDQVHLSPLGQQALAQAVIDSLATSK
ncbi:MAG TPA: GDSL-type esterase/lipase family protein [Planctomycetota bacterium]|nr:GDSL-type esterase/lipase family protein [Planctomycetota bacterium]